MFIHLFHTIFLFFFFFLILFSVVKVEGPKITPLVKSENKCSIFWYGITLIELVKYWPTLIVKAIYFLIFYDITKSIIHPMRTQNHNSKHPMKWCLSGSWCFHSYLWPHHPQFGIKLLILFGLQKKIEVIHLIAQ